MMDVNCPTCGRIVAVDPAQGGRSQACVHCGEPFTAPGGPPPKKKMSGLLISAIVLIALCVVGVPIVAIIAAIAIPGLLRSRIVSNERNTSASLKSLVTAEENFRSNDLDRNQVNDYWTGNIAGLYCLQVAATDNPIAALNDIGVASADIDSGNAAAVAFSNANVSYNSALLLTSSPKSGYAYQALLKDAEDAVYAQSTDGGVSVHNFGNFGFAAVPVAWDSTGNHVFIVNEGASVFRRDFGPSTAAVFFGTPLQTFDGSNPFNYPSAA